MKRSTRINEMVVKEMVGACVSKVRVRPGVGTRV